MFSGQLLVFDLVSSRYATRIAPHPKTSLTVSIRATSSFACMWRVIHLILPAILPSWRFFPEVEPSPRIEYRFPLAAEPELRVWRGWRPEPERVSARETLLRLFWNPRRNETLFMTSCAERLLYQGSLHARREMLARIAAEHPGPDRDADIGPPQLRLSLLQRVGEKVTREVVYVSDAPDPAGPAG